MSDCGWMTRIVHRDNYTAQKNNVRVLHVDTDMHGYCDGSGGVCTLTQICTDTVMVAAEFAHRHRYARIL
jgi:hypothetical protein